MSTHTLDDLELTTVIAALRLFRSISDLTGLPREQSKEMASIILRQIETSETGEPIVTLKPEEIDNLVDRLRSV